MVSDERAKLRALLNYWIEHNREHSDEFKEWADKARVLGEVEIAEEILQAAQEMDKASGLLSQSLKRLEEACGDVFS
jgi:nickel/cobalt exporter